MAQILRWAVFNILLTLVKGLPAHNVTLSVPGGFTNHGNNDLYSTQSRWYNILIFFALNYASHAATVKSRPGQTYMHTARDVVLSLLYPYAGLMRALESLARSSWTTNDLTKAARAGALCMVVRNKDWKPSWRTRILARMPNENLPETSCIQDPGENVELETEVTGGKISMERVAEQGVLDPSSNVISIETHLSSTHTHDESSNNGQDIELHVKPDERTNGIATSHTVPSVQETSESFAQSSRDKVPGLPSWLRSFLDKNSIRERNIHGESRLPEGYSVAMLPSNTTIVSSSHKDLKNVSISCSHSVPKVVDAIAQAIYASITVYRARGDQIDRFGYAAFSFTVIPYIVMSLMNLLTGLLLPDYPALYIVRSLESDEATLLGGTVDGTVGRLVQRRDAYLDFLRDSSVREKEGGQDPNSTHEGDVTKSQSMHMGSPQSHIEEDSPRLRHPQEATPAAGFTASVTASLPSNSIDGNHDTYLEGHRDDEEEVHSLAAQEGGSGQNMLRGDNEDTLYKSAGNVKCIEPNNFSYTPFARNRDRERWQLKTGEWFQTPSLAFFAAPYVFSAIPLGVIGVMTHFHKGHSTRDQRAWTMTWLAWNGYISPPLERLFDPNLTSYRDKVVRTSWAAFILIVVASAVPAIGGFVTVGQMLQDYGSCKVIDGL